MKKASGARAKEPGRPAATASAATIAAAPAGGLLPRAMLLLVALLLSVAAAREAMRLALAVPQIRYAVVEAADALPAARQRVLQGEEELRDAWNCAVVSRQIVRAATGRGDAAAAQRSAAELVRTVRSTRLPRVQFALARLMVLDGADSERGSTEAAPARPAAEIWAALRPYLEGLYSPRDPGGDAPDAPADDRNESGRGPRPPISIAETPRHQLHPLLDALAREYRAARLDPATARSLAELTVGAAHTAFLQCLYERFESLAERIDADGAPESAEALRMTVLSVLRQFVLEPGPAGLRLAAADLLACALEDESGAVARERTALARTLRQWREEVRAELRARPASALAIQSEPVLARAEYERAVRRLMTCTWMASGLAVSLLAALALGFATLTARGRTVGLRWGGAAGALVALGVLAGAWAWSAQPLDALNEELRRDFSSAAYGWRHPFLSAALALLTLVVAGVVRGVMRRGADAAHRLAATGMTGVLSTIVLAAALWAACGWASSALAALQRATADAEPLHTVIPSGRTDEMLNSVSAWIP